MKREMEVEIFEGHLRGEDGSSKVLSDGNGRLFPTRKPEQDWGCRKLGATTMADRTLFSLFFASDEYEVKEKGGFWV